MYLLRYCCLLALVLIITSCGGGDSYPGTPGSADALQGKRALVASNQLSLRVFHRARAVTGETNTDLITRNIVSNAGFENGDEPWVATTAVLVDSSIAYTGKRVAWLGGYDDADDSLYQDVALPAIAESITLRFAYGILTDEVSDEGAVDLFHVDVLDAESGQNYGRVVNLSNQHAGDAWVQSPAIDLTPARGRKIRLRFSATTDATLNSSFFVDDVAINVVTKPPLATNLTVPGKRADYSISGSAEEGQRLVPRNGGTSTSLASVNRIVFADTIVSFEPDGNPGRVFRLYQAAFDRVPDVTGIGFWIDAIDRQLVGMDQVAEAFISSAEFSAKYGKLTNADFVTQLYLNVLHRNPDTAGLTFWLDAMTKQVTRAQILVAFSESSENQVQVLPIVQAGIVFTPPGMVPAAPVCQPPMILQNGSCRMPAPECVAPQVLRNNACVTPVPTCVAPQVLQNNVCATPGPVCTPPNVLRNNVCAPPLPVCTPPQVLQNNVCVTPAPVCVLPKVLQNNVCVLPVPTCTANQALKDNVCVSTCAPETQYKDGVCHVRPRIRLKYPGTNATRIPTNARPLLSFVMSGMNQSETDLSSKITISPPVQIGGDEWTTAEAGPMVKIYKTADFRVQLKPATVYTVTVAADLANYRGIELGTAQTWSFTTADTCEVGVVRDGVCAPPVCPTGHTLKYDWTCAPPPPPRPVCRADQVYIEISNSCFTVPPIDPRDTQQDPTPISQPKPRSPLGPGPTTPGTPTTPSTPTTPTTPPPTTPHWAALAIDYNQGNQWGYAYDFPTVSQARQRALNECGSGCSVVLTYEKSCGAYATDAARGSTVYGWGTASTGAQAQSRALAECRSRGNSSARCQIRVWACNGN